MLNLAEMEAAVAELYPDEEWEEDLWEEFCREMGVEEGAEGLNFAQFGRFKQAMEAPAPDPEPVVTRRRERASSREACD